MMLGAHPMLMSKGGVVVPPSPTPATWTQGSVGAGTTPRRVYNGNGVFVITSDNIGSIHTSASGSSFATHSVSGVNNTRNYSYGAGVHLLAGGNSNRIDSSTDFVNYTARTIASLNMTYLHWSVDLSMFIAVGEAGAVRFSTTGIGWTNAGSILGGVNLTKVASGNGRAVAVGRSNSVAWTSDGATWNTVSLPFVASGFDKYITFGNGRFVLVDGGGEVATSTNGVTWTFRTTISSSSIDVGGFMNIQNVHSDNNGVVVFVGTTGPSSRGIYVSSNLVSYSAKLSGLPDGTQLAHVTEMGGTWVAVGGTAANLITYSNAV